ncbi:hypothetical protein CAJAP_02750 [Camponotus japonicus]
MRECWFRSRLGAGKVGIESGREERKTRDNNKRKERKAGRKGAEESRIRFMGDSSASRTRVRASPTRNRCHSRRAPSLTGGAWAPTERRRDRRRAGRLSIRLGLSIRLARFRQRQRGDVAGDRPTAPPTTVGVRAIAGASVQGVF